ncbi:hypothetical protein OPV22_028413 [Ensete ventricosum]|uniref:Uncharacterized protein n=1 Tax=Ensete ventricosum TaxID=4639 RepID=A0AAV8Q8J3_ENSVE|nr:hypothetical protein OPV22_028413 [Ensete ventricosum]
MDIGACQAPPKTAAELEWSCISNLSSPLSFPRISDICHGRVLGPLPPRTVGVKARDGHDAQAKKPPPGRSFRGIDHWISSSTPTRSSGSIDESTPHAIRLKFLRDAAERITVEELDPWLGILNVCAAILRNWIHIAIKKHSAEVVSVSSSLLIC